MTDAITKNSSQEGDAPPSKCEASGSSNLRASLQRGLSSRLSSRLLHMVKRDHKDSREEVAKEEPGSDDETSDDETRRRIVTFETSDDRVHLIQRWKEYSESVRGRLWTSHDEMKKNMKRSKREFMGERFDWRNAVEEEEMPVCPKTGQRVHPVHFLRERSRRTLSRRSGKTASTSTVA